DAALALVIFAPALALGSFLNVVAARLPEGRSLLRPRSACGSCEAEIAWYDNIPVFSYFMLRGRGCADLRRLLLRRPRRPLGDRRRAADPARSDRPALLRSRANGQPHPRA